MPLTQLIPAIGDRELTAGPGNWTGDFAWEPGPVWGETGFLAFDLPTAGLTKHALLNYPAFKCPPNSGITIDLLWYIDPAFMKGCPHFIYLLDGVYELTGENHMSWMGFGWGTTNYLIITPPDWDQLNATLDLRILSPELPPSYAYYKNFSATTPVGPTVTRPDHLSSMGVGR